MHTPIQLKLWRAIKSGELSQEELLALCETARIGSTTRAKDLLDRTHFPPHQETRQVNFGRLSLEELGLRPGDTTEKATTVLSEIGVELERFMPVYAFELALDCVHDRGMGTLVIPLSPFSQCSAMYVNPRSAGYRCSVRADQSHSRLEDGDLITFVIPE
jgi:hypothetical protein